MTAPLPVCSAKLSIIRPCQYYGWGQRWNPRCCSFYLRTHYIPGFISMYLLVSTGIVLWLSSMLVFLSSTLTNNFMQNTRFQQDLLFYLTDIVRKPCATFTQFYLEHLVRVCAGPTFYLTVIVRCNFLYSTWFESAQDLCVYLTVIIRKPYATFTQFYVEHLVRVCEGPTFLSGCYCS